MGVVKPIKRLELILDAVGDKYLVVAGPKEKLYAQAIGLHTKENVQHLENFLEIELSPETIQSLKSINVIRPDE